MPREVAGIVRVMQILEALAGSPDGVSVRDLSRAIGCGKGTISKLLDTLEDSDDVQNVFSNFDLSADVQAELENDE